VEGYNDLGFQNQMKKHFVEKKDEMRRQKLNKVTKSANPLKAPSTKKDSQVVAEDAPEEEDSDEWEKTTPVSLQKKFTHEWLEETKAIAKWQEKKVRMEEIIQFVKVNVNIEGKDLFEVCALVKLMINDSMSMLSTAGISVAGYLSKGVRKGFRN